MPHRQGRRLLRLASCLMTLSSLPLAGCDVWSPPIPTAAETDAGLIVLYPGALNTHTEMIGTYYGLLDAGIDQAIEVKQWGDPVGHITNVAAQAVAVKEAAGVEAARLAAYMQAHPAAPVTLIGYSDGAQFAVWVAERMPADSPSLSRLILLSASMSPDYDLRPAMDHTQHGAAAYWSPREQTTVFLLGIIGMLDGSAPPPAGTLGFTLTDDRLIQLEWTPDMAERFDQNGEHSDYIFRPAWITAYIAPWVPRSR